MSRKFVLFLIVSGMVLAGCAKTQASPPELVEGVDYIEGAAEVPAGKYLLVELKTEVTPCGRWPILMDFPNYNYQNGLLSGLASYPDEYDPENPIIGYFGHYITPASGKGSGSRSGLTAFQSLPFQRTDLSITILSIQSQGTIVVEIDGAILDLDPGESWSYRTKEKSTCWYQHERHDHTFINQGFLEESQIQLTNFDELRQSPEN